MYAIKGLSIPLRPIEEYVPFSSMTPSFFILRLFNLFEAFVDS